MPCTLTLQNPTGDRVAFKVKTTSPKKYCVRPSSGIVEPGSSKEVQVIMQAQREYPPSLAGGHRCVAPRRCVAAGCTPAGRCRGGMHGRQACSRAAQHGAGCNRPGGSAAYGRFEAKVSGGVPRHRSPSVLAACQVTAWCSNQPCRADLAACLRAESIHTCAAAPSLP